EEEAEEERDGEQGKGEGEDLIQSTSPRIHPDTGRNGKNCQYQQACRGKALFPPAADPVKKSVRCIEKIVHKSSDAS
ncbi:MAG: hypothetical protein D3910_28185, partial [Candidatus Electrothrix sp. ATG2]|nr:hypothetical protein [Candidatus Electrothrix sp. ATG2]